MKFGAGMRKAKGSKKAVLRMIERMPKEASVEDIMYALYFYQRIARGLGEVAAGKTVSHAKVKQSLAKWVGPGHKSSPSTIK